MKFFNTYLTFDGNCREAMTFYNKCLGGDLQLLTFSQAPMQHEGCSLPPGTADRVMHSRISKGDAVIMASDTMPGMPFTQGNNFSINIQCESADEAERLFKAFSDNGKITMPIAETFWAERFGMLIDQFGVPWMFNFEKPLPENFGQQSHKQEPVHA